MIRIAVCDDDQEDLRRLNKYVQEYFVEQKEYKMEVDRFSSGNELLNVMDKKDYDIYFLDILMPEVNGVELGEEIRARGSNALIVYITSSGEFAFGAYRVGALNYLEKPISKEALFQVLRKGLAIIKKEKYDQIYINTKEGIVNINLEDVMYVENVARSATYVLHNEKRIIGLCNRRTFEEAVGVIASHSDFVQTHKSFFVNMNYIQKFGSQKVVLDNGMEVSVSRSRALETKKKYLQFLAD